MFGMSRTPQKSGKVGMKARHATPPVGTVKGVAPAAAKTAVSMAEGMNLDKPAPVSNRFQTANPFKIAALQKRMNRGS